MSGRNILIWLPSPMGDAIMATPALHCFREHFHDDLITFLGSALVRQLLSSSPFCDQWISLEKSYLSNITQLRKAKFSDCILLKNSFGSAFTVLLAGIPKRIGYARDGRSWMLTDRMEPPRNDSGKLVPLSAIDYYLQIAEFFGADISCHKMELSSTQKDSETLEAKLSVNKNRPLIILVPGGAFGPSKCWASERYARVADTLIEQYNASIVISVAPNEAERKIAEEIQNESKNTLINLSDIPLELGPLKALYSQADLVITNDTGPRHIAIALEKKVITLFGPNNPAWAETGYTDEIQIVGTGPCVPCDKPVCNQTKHYCMESITVEQVLEAAKSFLEDQR